MSWRALATILAATLACIAGAAHGQTSSVTPIYSFTGPVNGLDPAAPVIQGSDGNFYGTTTQGGSHDAGTVFKITPAGVLTTLYAFSGGADGGFPEAGLIEGNDGNYYGTTSGGGDSNGDGAVFKITPAGIFTSLYTFTGGAGGASPLASLTQGSDGNLYGTTAGGGDNNGDGTIFKITPAGVLTPLHTFTGAGGADPVANLTLGSDGNFYGTTVRGGDSNGDGTIFKITPAGVFTSVYSFTGGAGGENPQGAVTQGSDGNFYGTTDGTVFKITPAGVLTSLHTFTGGADGSEPLAGLTLGGDGNFYGATSNGGVSNGVGTVFKITPEGVLTPLYTFTGGADGASPHAGLAKGSDGSFYGTTYYAGGGNTGGFSGGTVFKVTPGGVLTTLYTFTGTNDVASPEAVLTLGNDGNFYGTTYSIGSSNGVGTVFKITPAGVLTTLYSFIGGADGAFPEAGVTQGSDGNFYGTTFSGGNGNGFTGDGTVFKITPAGVLTTLYTFTGGADGASPRPKLLQGSDGDFYGTTVSGGGSNGNGTVFKITPAGALTTLYTFTGVSDGASPYAGLTLGSDGSFYGTTIDGGSGNETAGDGTVFRITPAGVFTSLYKFTGGAGGAEPFDGLALGSDGNFYGTTYIGGDSNDDGTVFKITPAGDFTTLYTFTGGADGANPIAGLTLGKDGNFYGATSGLLFGGGTVFKITPAGVLTTLYTFTGGADGRNPGSGLHSGRRW